MKEAALGTVTIRGDDGKETCTHYGAVLGQLGSTLCSWEGGVTTTPGGDVTCKECKAIVRYFATHRVPAEKPKLPRLDMPLTNGWDWMRLQGSAVHHLARVAYEDRWSTMVETQCTGAKTPRFYVEITKTSTVCPLCFAYAKERPLR